MTPFYAIMQITELLSEVSTKFTDLLSETPKIILVSKVNGVYMEG
jgi:hypothetical protein